MHNGELIIPAGAEVHGRASLDRARERIAASGKWVIVWRDSTPLNGTELVISGIALDRQKDDTNGEFGLRDGSAGLLRDGRQADGGSNLAAAVDGPWCAHRRHETRPKQH